MDFATYFDMKKSKNPKTTEKQAKAWYEQTAGFSAQHKNEDDFEEANLADVKEVHKEYPGLQYFRNGAIGRMEDFRLLGDEKSFLEWRNRLIRPLKKDRVWDYDGVDRPLIKAGQIPPPRFATSFVSSPTGRIARTTRRSCEAGRAGLACNHPVGSSQCNGGVDVYRRVGN